MECVYLLINCVRLGFVRIGIIGGALLLAGIVAVLLGIEPARAADALWNRVWPILLFVAAITVVAVLVAEAGVFAAAATRLAKWGAGRVWILWLLVCTLCVATTVFFSLDTTAVLVTPAVIALTVSTGLRAIPFAITTIWLANTASLLLPVSNLTNLLAQQASGLTAAQFFLLSWAPAIVAIVVPMAVIAIVFRRDLGGRFTSQADAPPLDRVLYIVAIIVLIALVPSLVSGIAVWIPACIAALVLAVAFALRRPRLIRVGMIPWSLLVFAAGLFLVIDSAHQLGLGAALTVASGEGTGFVPLLRLAGVGAVSSNFVNNLPAYLVLEPTAAAHPVRLMALLIGTNCGPLITPWASLATLLWHHRLTSMGVRVPWGRYILLGAIAAPLTVVGSVAALTLIGG